MCAEALRDPLLDAIVAMHENLPVSLLPILRSRANALAKFTGGSLKVATGCSGSDIVVLGLRSLTDYWHKIFGVEIAVEHCFSVENVSWKRQFIKEQVGPKHLFAEMGDMGADEVFDHITKQKVQVETPHLWICGIECDSVSSVSQHSSQNTDCVSSGTGATGTSADYCLRFIEKHKPLFVCFENVKNLDAASATGGGSNKAVILERLQALGYETQDFVMNANQYGAPQRRPRIYVLAAKKCDEMYLQEFGLSPARVRGMRIPASSLATCLLPDDHPGLRAWMAEKREKAENAPTKKARKSNNYATDHLEIYQSHGVPWPPVYSEEFRAELDFLPERQKEIGWLLHMVNEREKANALGKHCEIAQDINMSIGWGTSAWGEVPCIITSSVILLVERRRLLWGIEAMRLQMWPSIHGLSSYSHEQLMDLAGNAFCGGCIMGAVIALLMSAEPGPAAASSSRTRVQELVPFENDTLSLPETQVEDGVVCTSEESSDED